MAVLKNWQKLIYDLAGTNLWVDLPAVIQSKEAVAAWRQGQQVQLDVSCFFDRWSSIWISVKTVLSLENHPHILLLNI